MEGTMETEDSKEKGRNRKRLARSMIIILFLIFFVTVLAVTLSSGRAAKVEKDVVINEVVSSNNQSLTVDSLGSPDWIELYNSSNEDIDLLGYRIIKGSDKYIFGDTVIKANGYSVVYAMKGAAVTDSSVCVADFNIPSKGDTLYLADPQGAMISMADVPQLITDESYARRNDGTYGYCTSPTPGKQNDENGIKTEDQIKAEIDASDVIVSEVLPKGSGGESWVELYNRGTASADLGIFCLTDTKADAAKWHIPQSSLEPGKYAVIYMSGDEKNTGGVRTNFNIGKEDMGIYLFDITGGLKSSMTWDGALPGGVSVISNNKYSVYPTMGAANSTETFNSVKQTPMDDTDPVRIDEVLKKNKYGMTDSDGNRYGWVELYNKSSKAVSLKGYFLSDDSLDLFRWAFPNTQIPANGYVTVFLTGAKEGQKDMHTSFGLSDMETALYLTNESGMRVDTMTLPGVVGNDISVGRDSGGRIVYYSPPTPNEANGQGQSTAPQNAYAGKKKIYISEVSAASKANSGANDWVELHNSSNENVNIEGYYLSDDANNIKKWKIPSASIQAEGYKFFEASATSTSSNIAKFGISPSGETLLFSDPNGVVLDVFETGVLSSDITSGRPENDTNKRVYYTAPTKGSANSSDYKTGYTETPLFSETKLYQTKPFKLTITSATPQAKIYYTTDGTIPTDSSSLYSGSIPISDNKPVRAIAYANGLLPSEVVSYTYIFDSPHTVPTICINGKQGEMSFLLNSDSRAKPEYLAGISYYEADGTLGVSFVSGVRPKGKSSLALPQNSISIALRSDYGQKEVNYKFFNDSNITMYSTLCLRSSGQDSTRAKIRDSYFQTISQGMNVTSIKTRPVVLYVNGKYSGLYDLDEDQSGSYFQTHYGIKKGNLDLINVFANKAQQGDKNEWNHILSITRTWNLADDEVFAEYKKFVDTDAIKDYLIAKIYFGNGDGTNQRYFRARDYSVKWTPVLFDLDYNLRFEGSLNQNVFGRYFSQTACIGVGQSGNGINAKVAITWALKKNKQWCKEFEERFVQIAETQYNPDKILPIYDSMVSAMKPEMQDSIDRYHKPSSMTYWLNQTSGLREILSKRREEVLDQLQGFFSIPSSQMKEWEQKYSSQS